MRAVQRVGFTWHFKVLIGATFPPPQSPAAIVLYCTDDKFNADGLFFFPSGQVGLE